MKKVLREEEESVKESVSDSFSSNSEVQEFETKCLTAINKLRENIATKKSIMRAFEEELSFNFVPSQNKYPNDDDAFIAFALQQDALGQDVHTFIKWWKVNGNKEVRFWSVKQFMKFWPQAFQNKQTFQLEPVNPLDKWNGHFVPAPARVAPPEVIRGVVSPIPAPFMMLRNAEN